MTSEVGRRLLCALLFAAVAPLSGARLQDALDLESKGKLQEASEVLRSVVSELRASPDVPALARALSISSRIAVSLGEYRSAIQSAGEAVVLRTKLRDQVALSEDYNTLGLANLYLGNYDQALQNYRKALEIDRSHHDTDAEIIRLNNIGNIYYFRGQYQDALNAYQQGMNALTGAGNQPWFAKRKQLTIANLASLYQRLGKEETALELYGQLTATPQALARAEYAQLLLNEGVLYRRLGDPVKALERYETAQSIFAAEHHRDGEIGALRNIGIVRATDLKDLEGARVAFTAALDLARKSADTRGIVQVALHRAELYRRLGLAAMSKDDLATALAGARKSGLVEEQWKSEYGMGKLAEAAGDLAAAAGWYRQAIAGIESVRAGMRRSSLRSDFLADKREVYDSQIALDLRQVNPDLEDVLSLMERSRARALEERSPAPRGKEPTLRELENVLPSGTVLSEFWLGEGEFAALWITHASAGVVRGALDGELEQHAAGFAPGLQNGHAEWRTTSRRLGERLLAGIPAARHAIIAPDGFLAALPFEALTLPGSDKLLIEECDVSYVPAARFVTRPAARRNPAPPWSTQLVAYGDPPVQGPDALANGERWQPLAAAADEVKSISRLLPARGDLFLGHAAQKRDLVGRNFAGVSLLHFATHAVVDAENPERSRILMASQSSAAPLDYLFQQEIYGLNLTGVDLATVSACETARGKIVRGDGVRAFSQAFLAAGASATVTSLWQVSDRPTAEFMKQFYYFLSTGVSKAEALRQAKLRFLQSGSAWSAPRYWSAFVLNGDGWNACRRFFGWGWLAGAAGGLALAAGIVMAVLTRR